MGKIRICVLGAGVSGLASAICIQDMLEEELGLSAADYSLDIVAEQFSPNLTSDVAGGFLFPYLDAASKDDIGRLVNWSRSTWDYFTRLWKSAESQEAGLQLVHGYLLTLPGAAEPEWKDLLMDFHRMTSQELQLFPGYSAGFGFTSYICEQTLYLRYLTRKLQKKGVRFIQRRVSKLTTLGRDYDLVVNCTGVGASHLLDDHHLIPIRGQVLRVKAPWVKIFVSDATPTTQGSFAGYILPNVNHCVLGGTHDMGEWNLTPSSETTKDILKSCAKLIPGIEKSEVISVHCGLRPGRYNVRLEKETIVDERGEETMVVHNYGHGGIGVTLQMGCASQVAELTKSCIQQIMMKSKL